MFNILTITLGRALYLRRLLKSVDQYAGNLGLIQHTVVFQGNSVDESVFLGLSHEYRERISVVNIAEIVSVGALLNAAKGLLGHEYTLKLDDDAVLRSPDFFVHAKELISIVPNSVFSPFPVGLINNPGGVPSSERKVVYGQETDTFYTLRKVPHVGGFSRFSATSLMKSVHFSNSHNEDSEFSSACEQWGIDMFYLENGLIVEHQESTLGQHARYGHSYFKGRF